MNAIFVAKIFMNQIKNILLHYREGNKGKYLVRGWQYWPDQREGQYRTQELNIFPYCPTKGSAIIDLLYDWVNNKVATTQSPGS